MSTYFEYLMDLWRIDIDEFLQQALGLLGELSPGEKDRVIELFVRSLPSEVVAKWVKQQHSEPVSR